MAGHRLSGGCRPLALVRKALGCVALFVGGEPRVAHGWPRLPGGASVVGVLIEEAFGWCVSGYFQC